MLLFKGTTFSPKSRPFSKSGTLVTGGGTWAESRRLDFDGVLQISSRLFFRFAFNSKTVFFFLVFDGAHGLKLYYR